MTFKLKPLPFEYDALSPAMSRRTLELHHKAHHGGYVDKLNELVGDGPLARADLASVVRAAAKKPKQVDIYNNAAQVWNHDFFWDGLAPTEKSEPSDTVRQAIVATFESMDNFKRRFLDVATGHFGSGWAWLVASDGRLDIVDTHDADSPLITDAHPLWTCDLWEHAYYVDYQNRRAEYVSAVLDKLINWRQVADRLAEAGEKSVDRKKARAR
jgi:superoxide dismutase, Fe-Mn family